MVDLAIILDKKILLIEYNGIGHYRKTNFGHKLNNKLINKIFKEQVERDNWLRNFCCNDKNIELVEIDGRKYKDDKIRIYLESKFSK